MDKKTENRSLFLYTGLIFIAAIAVIAFSFFSQINVEKKHNEYAGEDLSGNSIVEKTAMLSEENRILLETTNSLNNEISKLNSECTQLKEKVLNLDMQVENTDKMYDIFTKLQEGNVETAAKIFETLEPLFFTEDQEDFYIYLQKRIRKLYNR